MKKLKAYKYRLRPTVEQERKLLQHGGSCRFLWNNLLADNQQYYKSTGKFKFYHEMATSLPQLKQQHTFLTDVFSQSAQQVCRHLDRALKDSFKQQDKGFPNFKSKHKFSDSWTIPQKYRLAKHFVFIPKIGEVKWIRHRMYQGNVKHITISQEGSQWYCSVTCEIDMNIPRKQDKNVVGIDLGLRSFVMLSDGTSVPSPKCFNKSQDKLAKLQRQHAKKQKRSKNKLKLTKKIQDCHRHIRNQRKDFLHKLSHDMITKYDGFCLEDLSVKSLLKDRSVAKSISDASWSDFSRQLEYKSDWYGKHYVEIDRYFPSTKTCSECGNIQYVERSAKVYKCKNCSLLIDRDLNASLNIKSEGLKKLNISKNTRGHLGINACGDDVRLISNNKQLSMNQEKCPLL